MLFSKIDIEGAFLVELEKISDERGYFARAWCKEEFEKNNLKTNIVQCNLSQNNAKGTLRGMHYQTPPYQEVKMVRCIKGRIYDVIVDIRKHSPTFGNWFGVELNENEYNMLYVPEGVAHGYQTLEDDSVVYYQVTEFYNPNAEAGVRYNDPEFDINWPMKVQSISDKDLNWPDYIPGNE